MKPDAHEEPEFNAERDIPTEDDDETRDAEEDGVLQKPGDAADDESVAGEEDPGAALELDEERP